MQTDNQQSVSLSTTARAHEIFNESFAAHAARTDRMFAVLMVLQWLGAIIAACVLTPRSWNGSESSIHIHVWLSVLLGGVLTSLPVYLAVKKPGHWVTRYTIAVVQTLFSSLLIHISGGRIETHFHVFGSLAFLAFYRDWLLLVPATLLVAADHFLRGVYWPQSVFGMADPGDWRWIEHTAWVLFLDIFLFHSCRSSAKAAWFNACRTAELERTNGEILQQTAELQRTYRSKQLIIDNALDAIIGMNSDGEITSWNTQAQKTFGWSADEVLGKPVAEIIIPPAYREQHERARKHFLATGEGPTLNRRIEVSALRRDGREFPIELAISPIPTADGVSFYGFARDITDRLQVATAMREAKEAAETASEQKSAFLAHMSHEIRTPLNGVLGFTDLLLKDIDGDVEQRREFLRTIHSSGRHLLNLLNDILDLSKIETGKLQVERVTCSPHQVIAEVISIMRVPAEERGLVLEYFWKSDIPQSIQSDPARLRQVLINLIGNAIKFTDVGSVQVAATLQRDLQQLSIDVIDTGVGISREGISKIFDPFVQADSSITRRFGGTGLGLSISRRLAQLMNGDVTVVSEVGRGSIFTATVETGPLDDVSMSSGTSADIIGTRPTDTASKPQRLPPCRILLVEDGDTNRKLLRLVLEKAGATVYTAENGKIGVDMAARESFDLILMDMQMPVLDGYTAARVLRESGYTMPIIALTAHAMRGDREKCLDAGCTGYLTKPIESERLLQHVFDCLECSPPGRTLSDVRIDVSSARTEARLESTLPLDDAEFLEIVEEFIVRLSENLRDARTALAAQDFDQVARIAHWVKGSGGTSGFDALTAPAVALEGAARSKLAGRVDETLTSLEKLLARMEAPVVAS